MTEEEVLMELRTIKVLLAIDKRDDLEQLTSGLSRYQVRILRHLDASEWRGVPTSEIAEEMDAHPNTIRNHITDLENRRLVERRGDGGGTEYRITGLLGCAELFGLVDSHEDVKG